MPEPAGSQLPKNGAGQGTTLDVIAGRHRQRKGVADRRICIPGMFGHAYPFGIRRAVHPLWVGEGFGKEVNSGLVSPVVVELLLFAARVYSRCR
jgi:hypothetical protein